MRARGPPLRAAADEALRRRRDDARLVRGPHDARGHRRARRRHPRGSEDLRMSSMESIYREEILEHYKRPHNWGHIEPHDLSFEDTNPLCGDELRVEIKTDADNKIEDVRFSGHGCAISQASASMAS